MRRNKETLGPPGPASFVESKTRIVGFDWSTGHPDRVAVSPDATSCVPEVQPPSASDESAKLSRCPRADDSDVPLAPAQSTARSTRLGDDPKVDAEFARFVAVAVPMPGGGLYDPTNGTPEMPGGVSIEAWRAFENDCAHLGRGSKS